ncbi:tryptophan 2,3-dioxygenase family protein [Streptomyces hundungensis]|uniref:tryptophan 2,3-dioxygenase family protein n=1 Tax=Streptomyces hundungensis TaxID=1077946 RepID=UPI0033F73B8F
MSSSDYARYLALDDLLGLQRPLYPAGRDPAVEAAERFFIVAHQTSELWLAQAALDIDAAVDALAEADGSPEWDGPERALEHLGRVTGMVRVLDETVRLLERLPLQHFAAFRHHLGTASGAQSRGFHALDDRLGTASDGGTSPLYSAYLKALAAGATRVEEVCERGAAGAGVHHRVAEALLDLGYAFWRWKITHLSLVDRTVGGLRGTGGSTGLSYLAARVRMPFPELRAAREERHTLQE